MDLCTVPGIGEVGIYSPAWRGVLRQAKRLHGDRLIPVLIEGETGTGKEVVARYIHNGGESVNEPFVALNCAAITPDNAGNELFGYLPGAYGTIQKGKKGWLDMAQQGTLFLDHICEMPLHTQAKLLRVIEEWAFIRVGGLKRIEADIRVVCSASADLAKQVDAGTFRADLYFRLSAARLYIPPLRARKEDILPLAHMFLVRFTQVRGKRFREISGEAASLLTSYEWPGNIRELQNTIQLAVLMWDDTVLRPGHLSIPPRQSVVTYSVGERDEGDKGFSLPSDGLPLEEFNNSIILKALEMHHGNKTRTAKYLGISRRSLDCRLKRLSTVPL